MYSVSLLLLVLTVQTDGFTPSDVQCFECHGSVNNYNVVGYSPRVINYCSVEDIPNDNDINFGVRWDENGGGELTDSLKIEFAPPKKECKYGIALLADSSIEDERECGEYKFEETGDANSKIHTIERTICALSNTNQLVRYNETSTVSLCEGNIELWFQYIFTGCYALRFHIGRQKYIIRGHKYLNTTYPRSEVTEPQFTCKYDTYSNPDERHEETNFTLDISLLADTGLSLQVALISQENNDLEKGCIWQGEPLISSWLISLAVSTFKEVLTHHHCNIKLVQAVNGKYIKTVQCNFPVQTTQTAGYCFIFRVIDDRCYKNTIWKPPHTNRMPCTWAKRCVKTSKSSLHIDSTNMIKSDKLLSTSSYLLLPIIAIVLIVSATVGALCFWHYLRIRKEEVNLYVNPQHDDFLNPACLKSTDFSIVDNNDSEKGIDHDNFTCDDIVLLYTKSSPSFMALMKDFRETLAKMCSCSVHDWHDGAEWNDVAKIGPVLWFSELLNSGCRVIWIDTPSTRSIVISNSRGSDSNLNKLSKYYDIGDFRDVTFPVVLELAKRNTKDAIQQYRRHFVVRFEGLESTANVNDPFLDVSPHARYRMPHHLGQLCSDLSVVKPIIPKYMMKAEEDLLQQRLKFIKIESIM